MKLRSAILRFFPPPRFLAMPAAGVDISDRSIKYVLLTHRHGAPCLVSYGEFSLTPGVVEGGKVQDALLLGEALKQVRNKLNAMEIVLALPEEQAYAFFLSLPHMARRDIRASTELQLENQIPVSVQSVHFDYDVVQEHPDGGYEIVVSAISRDSVKEYVTACGYANLKPIACEVEAEALARALLVPGKKETVLIVDLGKTRTGLAVVTNGHVAFTSTVQGVGGEDITSVIQKSLKIPRDLAEQYKIERGLSRSQENRDVFYALIPMVSVLKDEIVRRREYWNVHEREARGALLEPVSRVILTGGQSTLPGLDEYLSENIGCRVDIVSPWLNVPYFDGGIPPIPFNESLGYTTATGLALRGLNVPLQEKL